MDPYNHNHIFESSKMVPSATPLQYGHRLPKARTIYSSGWRNVHGGAPVFSSVPDLLPEHMASGLAPHPYDSLFYPCAGVYGTTTIRCTSLTSVWSF